MYQHCIILHLDLWVYVLALYNSLLGPVGICTSTVSFSTWTSGYMYQHCIILHLDQWVYVLALYVSFSTFSANFFIYVLYFVHLPISHLISTNSILFSILPSSFPTFSAIQCSAFLLSLPFSHPSVCTICQSPFHQNDDESIFSEYHPPPHVHLHDGISLVAWVTRSKWNYNFWFSFVSTLTFKKGISPKDTYRRFVRDSARGMKGH